MSDEPTPTSPQSEHFLMPVEDVLKVPGRGTAIVGTVARGTVHAGQTVELVGTLIQRATVDGIELTDETPHRRVDHAQAGRRVGLSLSNFDKTETKRGVVLADPATIRPHSRAEARLRIAAEADGGVQVDAGAALSARFHHASVSAKLTFPEGTGRLLPGTDATVTVELRQVVAMEVGTAFTLADPANRKVVIATGTVTGVEKPAPLRA